MVKNNKTIFLTDDDSSFRLAIATELRSLGYVVISAEDGERAIKMIQSNCNEECGIDLVITDLVMPRKDGLRFCNELRELCKEVPVLVISGFLSDEIVQDLKNLGSIDYLEKPFSPDELINKIEQMIPE